MKAKRRPKARREREKALRRQRREAKRREERRGFALRAWLIGLAAALAIAAAAGFVAVPRARYGDAASTNLYLDVGTYFVQVGKGAATWIGAYRLSVEAEAFDGGERESNDTWETAMEITLDERIEGSFAYKGDVDCFRFALPSDGLVSPELTLSPVSGAGAACTMTLTNGVYQLVTIHCGEESGEAISPFVLPAGNYYVKLESPVAAASDYSLRLSWEPVGTAEKEPNNDMTYATPLKPGAPVTGSLMTREDADVYVLNFTEETEVTLSFTFDQAAASDALFVLELEKNGDVQPVGAASGRDGGLTRRLRFVSILLPRWIL